MSGSVRLLSVQHHERVARLRGEGVLRGDWSLLVGGYEGPYRRMIDYMARCGVDTEGRPPVWAWLPPLTLGQVAMMFDPAHELINGYCVFEFEAPRASCFLSGYGGWSDYLEAVISTGAPRRSRGRWTPMARCRPN